MLCIAKRIGKRKKYAVRVQIYPSISTKSNNKAFVFIQAICCRRKKKNSDEEDIDEEPNDNSETEEKTKKVSKIRDSSFQKRKIIGIWIIDIDGINESCSWQQISGGKSMGGGQSSLIKIPKKDFVEFKKYFN